MEDASLIDTSSIPPKLMICLEASSRIAEFHKGKVLGVEPNINELPASLNIELVSIDVAGARADIAVLLVDHKEFRVSGAPDIKIILDTKGIWL